MNNSDNNINDFNNTKKGNEAEAEHSGLNESPGYTAGEADEADDAFNIPEELKKLPSKPGVYIMHGPKDEIIYVGKAVNLKNRVRQYFQSPKGKTDKIKKMISLIRRFEYIVVDSEMEALVLENNLIKENSPKYNTLLKDDKTYPYIKVTVEEDFPRIMMTRKVRRDRAKYFGPYTSSSAVKDTIDLLHKLFRIRSCSRRLPQDIGKERPCLYYHLGQCLGPCGGFIKSDEYRKHIDRAVDFLSGKYDYVKRYLKGSMQLASDSLEFEKAIEYRELLNEIEVLASSQKVTAASDTDDRDIIGISELLETAAAQVFFIRDGRMIGRECFHLDIDKNDEVQTVVQDFIKQYYSGTPYIPKEIWVQSELPERELLEGWLTKSKGRTVRILTPKKGDKEKLVEMAVKNAENQLMKDFEKLKRDAARTKGAAEQIRELLDIDSISRIESYDISNTNGFESVGSMVVFADGRPKNSDYRKFRIKTVTGPDDYASIREVLTRRFSHGIGEIKGGGRLSAFGMLPDLIMMDGGRGQVNIALSVLSEFGLSIPVCGMVKDDYHRTRGLYFNNKELPIDIHSEAFKLITRIQDETHRFAIEYHKSLRSREQVKSILDDIPGIGDVRRKALLRHFKDINAIREADTAELAEADGMNYAAATAVYEFFHSKEAAK